MSAIPSVRSAVALGPGPRAVVAAYARLNPWIQPEDLEQEAAVAAIESSRTWRPDGGASMDWYQARAVALTLLKFVAEQRAPVTLPKRTGVACQLAASMGRVALSVVSEGGAEREHPGLAAVAVDGYVPIEDRIDLARAAAEVRRVLAEESDAARAVLLAEEKSAAVAKRMGLRVRDVYDQTFRAMTALREALCRPRAPA